MSKKTDQKSIPNLAPENSVVESKDLDTPQAFDVSAIDLDVASNSKSKKIENIHNENDPRFEVSVAPKTIGFSLKTSNAHISLTKTNNDKKLVFGIKDQDSNLELHKTVGKALNVQSGFLTESTQRVNGSTIASSLSGKSVLSSKLVNFLLVQENKEIIKGIPSSDLDSKQDPNQLIVTDQISASLKFGANEKNPQLLFENTKILHSTINSSLLVDEKSQAQKEINSKEEKIFSGLALERSSASVFFQHTIRDARKIVGYDFHKTEELQHLEFGVNQKGTFIKASESYVDTVKNSGQKIDLTISDHLEVSLKANRKGVSAEFGVATKALNFNRIASVSGKIAYESANQTSYVVFNRSGKNQTYGIGIAHNLGGGVCLNASIDGGNHTSTTAKLQLSIPLGSTNSYHKKDCDVTKFSQLNLSSTENLKRALQQIPISFDENNASRGL